MPKAVKLYSWIKDKLEYAEDTAKTARLLNHYHRLRIHEAEIESKLVRCRECPHRH